MAHLKICLKYFLFSRYTKQLTIIFRHILTNDSTVSQRERVSPVFLVTRHKLQNSWRSCVS